MASRLHHVHLFASNLDESLAFYARWFDATVVADYDFAGSRNVMVEAGGGRLNFYDQAPRDMGRNAVHHLGFQVDDLASLTRQMADAGMELGPIRVLPELDYIMIEAPDGVLLEVFQYKGTDNPAPGIEAWFG